MLVAENPAVTAFHRKFWPESTDVPGVRDCMETFATKLTTMFCVADALVFPDESVAVTVNVCVPISVKTGVQLKAPLADPMLALPTLELMKESRRE